MRTLKISSGIAVLLTTAAFGHLLHHHYIGRGQSDAAFWAMMAVGVVVGAFSTIGGCLLLRPGR